MQQPLNFRISSALKDIIGRNLITDDNIAVFELVKNAYDAYATQVDIYFDDIHTDNTKITIKDNGKGMNLDDLENKWLFVAYSAKKEGTEDDSLDYRNRIYTNRLFAGAKGIGRFSCDKLGKKLYLETTKQETNPTTQLLFTDWEKFENNLKEEFIEVTVLHDTKDKSDYGLEHGTVLVITELRSTWNRSSLLKLKDSLAKLINPNKEKGQNDFKILIHVPEEQEEDDNTLEDYKKVNGEVKNFIFETLGLKTTRIMSSISNDGKYITTELKDGDTLIYKIKEYNNFELLDDINVTLYYLNMSAKLTFIKRMGLSSNLYGHVFLYKNGFRIYPYGEPGEDPLKVDVRKVQGYRRFLGNRELIGQIEIFSQTADLHETSTRGDGLIKTNAYHQLENFFQEVLRRLERYVVDVQQWGLSIEDDKSSDLKARISDLLAKLTGNEDLIEFETPENFFNIIEASQSNSADTIVKNLYRIAVANEDSALEKEVHRASARLKEIKIAKEEAEKESEIQFKKAQEATARLREKISENLFLKSINASDYEEVIALLHHIGIYAGTIDNNLRGISLRIQNDISLTKDELYNIIRTLSFETKKILNVVAFATKANFKLKTEAIEIDLENYITEYIQNIIPTVTDRSLKINIDSTTKNSFIRTVKPIEINIVVDNLISNSKKAKADKLSIFFKENEKDELIMEFVDNGIGISEQNLRRIFDFGFTTTDGSGIGLYHVKEILDSIKAHVAVYNNENNKGVTFLIQFK